VDPIYRKKSIEMMKGGAGESTHERYIKNFAEFLRTMKRIGISEDLAWTFPTPDPVRIIYMVNCAMIRKRENTWDTMRNKLRSMDHVAELCGINQEWPENAVLKPYVNWYKANRPNEGSDTKAITWRVMKPILERKLRKVVFNGEIKGDPKKMEEGRRRWWLTEEVMRTKESRKWYAFTIGMTLLLLLGTRGAEHYRSTEKERKGWGIQLRDVVFYWNTEEGVPTIKEKDEIQNLHHARIRLRYTKTGKRNKSVYLRLGRTEGKIDPLMLLYMLKLVQKNGWYGKCRAKGEEDYLFETDGYEGHLKQQKKMWKMVVEEAGCLEKEKYRMHGTRKGFATALMRKGVQQSLISFAGRWAILGAINRYIHHTQEELIPLAQIIMYGKDENKKILDLDEEERKAIGALNGNKKIDSTSFENTMCMFEERIYKAKKTGFWGRKLRRRDTA